ncbi:hypothetical protein [Nocardioides sp. URHA0020]|uniref:hypothetical protein n=1 Tax=Nocardioides sp. URHA0020 TaxID=1380392 RepID=UPI0004917B07|nr:hypothetical protein [Nocardioides sp. URHA0020]
MTVVSTTLFALSIAFLVVAAATALVSIAAVGQFVVTNRRARLARHESVRSHYGSFSLTS